MSGLDAVEPGIGAAPLRAGVRRLLLTYSPLLLVAVVWGLARFAGFDRLSAFGWLPGALGMGLTAWYMYRASRAPHLCPAGRRFWRRLALACALIAPSTNPLTEANIGVGAARPGPLLIIAMTCLVGALLLVVWALVRLPVRTRSRRDWSRLGLDAATVLVCAATFLWHLVLQPALNDNTDMRTVLGLVVLCGLCLLAVLVVVKLMLAGVDAVDGVALRILAVGVLLGALGSALIPVLADARLAGVSNVITTSEAVLASLAAVVQLHRKSTTIGVNGRRRSYSVLPYVAVGALDALLLSVTIQHRAQFAVVIGAVVATAIVVVRQLLAFRDNASLVTSLREHQLLLREQATHDALTGLPNRALFNETLGASFTARAPSGASEPLTALLIDLDDFKTVNDTLGHLVGDGLLVEVGGRLRTAVRPGDLVARLGGDEFAILLPGTAHAQALEVAACVLAELEQPVTTHGHRLPVGISLGIAERRPDDDPQSLLRHADIAMYAAKRRGKGQLASYTPDLEIAPDPHFTPDPPVTPQPDVTPAAPLTPEPDVLELRTGPVGATASAP